VFEPKKESLMQLATSHKSKDTSVLSIAMLAKVVNRQADLNSQLIPWEDPLVLMKLVSEECDHRKL
jgi:hypothetical protein